MTKTTIDVLAGIFTDPNFELFEMNCYWGEAAKIGVVIASQNWKFPNYALNEPSFTRLLSALENGRAKEVWVVFARDDHGHRRAYRGAKPAAELRDQIKEIGLEPIDGKFGLFYILPYELGPNEDERPF